MTVEEQIKIFLAEDIGEGDHTSLSTIPAHAEGKAKLLCKAEGIIAGVEVAKQVMKVVDDALTMDQFMKDGDQMKFGDIAFHIHGKSRSILIAERLILNLMQRMSGIATKTNHMVSLIEGTGTKLLDTRKTTPGIRYFEKLAVKIGGGVNHRFGLYDMVMIKDNHIDYAGGIAQAIDRTKKYLAEKEKDIKIEVEARNLDEMEQILAAGPVDRIMLDNFNYADLRTAVARIGGQAETEASGGINEETIRDYAECGVDYISSGALTHSVYSLDLSLKSID